MSVTHGIKQIVNDCVNLGYMPSSDLLELVKKLWCGAGGGLYLVFCLAQAEQYDFYKTCGI